MSLQYGNCLLFGFLCLLLMLTFSAMMPVKAKFTNVAEKLIDISKHFVLHAFGRTAKNVPLR